MQYQVQVKYVRVYTDLENQKDKASYKQTYKLERKIHTDVQWHRPKFFLHRPVFHADTKGNTIF